MQSLHPHWLRGRGAIAQLLSRDLQWCYYSKPLPHSEGSPAMKPSECHGHGTLVSWLGTVVLWMLFIDEGQVSGWLPTEPTAT